MSEEECSVLSIQSTVVYGYVGNKSATFPLQVLGFDVSTINSVQFSNHTGYGKFKGQILDSNDIGALYEGLKQNNLLKYSHVLTGYIGSKSFLEKVGEMVSEIKAKSPSVKYVCDPVMGDHGKMVGYNGKIINKDRLYVPQELLPVYRDVIIPLADIITPNQFELELLTEVSIRSIEDCVKAIDILHERGVVTVVLSSSLLGNDGHLLCIASSVIGGKKESYKVEMPFLPATFSGTGDLFAATLLAWIHKDKNLKTAIEKTVSTLQAVIRRTLDHAISLAGQEKPTTHQLELRLIQSKKDIENPDILYKASDV
ncbi:pyridoxal kinase isoform X1 [Patella vulgata]|uniref:pyridoxal kinase isoform X1 n=1 Tax=Patella vulgata TaxID=6465 RepID=UPI00217F9421|nr:pyridoxal kinase isoform X1 [Patella vulgata]